MEVIKVIQAEKIHLEEDYLTLNYDLYHLQYTNYQYIIHVDFKDRTISGIANRTNDWRILTFEDCIRILGTISKDYIKRPLPS